MNDIAKARKLILEHLLGIQQALPALADACQCPPYRYEIGICYNVLNNLGLDLISDSDCLVNDLAYKLIKKSIARWPECMVDGDGDKDTTFPVDDVRGYYYAAAMGELYRNPLRVQLLEHMIKEFSDA